jgi:hypothetical protein
MDSSAEKQEQAKDKNVKGWAAPRERLKVGEVPSGASEINLEGRQLSSPIQGFGPMWERIYRVRLSGANVSPEQVVADWKENFARFQPSNNHFYPSLTGIQPGEIVYINSTLPLMPGTPGLIPIRSGVMVLFSDDVMFTVMTPQGFPISGFNTFTAYEEDGCTVAEVRGLIRSSDPIYEFGFRFMGGEKQEDKVWFHVLGQLAQRWGVNGQVHFHKVLIDPDMQWKFAGNVFQNAAIRTFFYVAAAPLRMALKPFRRK